MPGRIVRSQTAQRVAQLVDSRTGRNFLTSCGWRQGMPIVMTQPTETVDEVMGLVSVHMGPALVALIEDDELVFLHISETCDSLRIVDIVPDGLCVSQFLTMVRDGGHQTFRVKYWKYSAVAHVLPPVPSLETEYSAGYRHVGSGV